MIARRALVRAVRREAFLVFVILAMSAIVGPLACELGEAISAWASAGDAR